MNSPDAVFTRARDLVAELTFTWVFAYNPHHRMPYRFEAYRGGCKRHGYSDDPEVFLATIDALNHEPQISYGV